MSGSAETQQVGERARLSVACFAASVILLTSFGVFGQVAKERLPDEELASLYAEHDQRVLRQLPPHSALPPLLDLSKPGNGGQGAGKKWEDGFAGSMGVRPIDTDPGVPSAGDATSISVTTTEYAGQFAPLPARTCDVVMIGEPETARTRIAYNHRFVYAVYDVQIGELLKGKIKHSGPDAGHLLAAQLGGSVRFLSGHEAAFWEANEGFMGLGKQYLLFLWKPVSSSDTYMVDEAYLLQDSHVFPIILRSNESRYADMPADAFVRKVKAVIAKNIDGM